MLSYSFHCKFCGYTFMDNSKDKVRMVRESHKQKGKNGTKHCTLVHFKLGHWCRPDLVQFLLEREAENEKENASKDVELAKEAAHGGDNEAGDLQGNSERSQRPWTIGGEGREIGGVGVLASGQK